MLEAHIPYLLKMLDPIHAEWYLFGTALDVDNAKLGKLKDNPEAPGCKTLLLRVIIEFGKSTAPEQRTWRKIYDAVCDLDRFDIAETLEEGHPDLDGLCKYYYNLLW